MTEKGTETQQDRLFLSNRHDVQTAHHATARYGYADNAHIFLEKIIWLYPPEAQFVDLKGEPATKIMQEIVEVLDVAVNELANHPHFVIAAQGLLNLLRSD